MITLQTPNGLSVDVPETLDEDISPKFTVEQLQEVADYYKKHGYVVFKDIIDKKICEDIREVWDAEV
jgi:hypothetical protein